jgi:O-antigen ligase
MRFHSPEHDAGFEHSFHYRGMCVLLVLWWLAFLYPNVTVSDVVGSLMSASDSTSAGSIYNQVLVVSLAAMGLVHLPRALRCLEARQTRMLLSLLATYLVWAALTTVWSADRALTVRRLIALVLLLAGCFGLGAGFYTRTRNAMSTLAQHVLWAVVICVTLLFVLRLAEGDLMRMLDPAWNLKYTTQIESYAYPLLYGIVALPYLFRASPVPKFAIGGVFFLILVILKGRTLILDVVSATGITSSRYATNRFVRASLLTVSVALAAILADLMTGGAFLIQFVLNASDSMAGWMPYLSIGEGLRNITTLSGRLPLWQDLLRRAAERPYFGHGFGAFWTPGRFAEVFATTKWYAVVAHNGYLDEILATGVVGLVLLMAFWIYGMVISYRLGSGGYLVFAWMVLFLYLNTMGSIIQSYFMCPTFITLTGLFIVADEYRVYRCEACGEKLALQTDAGGEVVLCHP